MIDSLDVIPVGVPDTFPVVVFGASAGGIEALATILSALPDQFLAAIAIVQHRSSRPGSLAAVLTYLAKRSVRDAVEGDLLSPGCVFVAPAGSHLLINPDGTLSLSDSAKVRSSRPAADRLFESGAESLKERLIAVVLTGGDFDGSNGVQAVKRLGGRVIAQDEATSQVYGMPGSAIATGSVDFVLPLGEIGPALTRLVAGGVA
jgi:two-component system, chemotaxis family, protein-glutamate methylesterase/glutaminase